MTLSRSPVRPRHAARRRACALVLSAAGVVVVACGGSTSDPGPDPSVIRVGGEYATAVSLTENSCPGISVQNLPTTVAHAPGAATLTVTHAANAYQGALQTDGRFTTTPRSLSGPGEVHRLSIAGRFTTTGFDATVTVDVQRDAAPETCRYVVRWVGTKQGAPNVIPGA